MSKEFIFLSELIERRRAVYPPFYRPEKIDKNLIIKILKNATWAPTHKRTEPWRFAVLTDTALQKLSAALMQYYVQNTSQELYAEAKHKKSGERPLQSACVLVICISRSSDSVIPAWEETAAVACAVQNMWLSASALGLGAYWSTPAAIKTLPKALGLPEDWECLGLFYMGWLKEGYPLLSERRAVDDVTIWLDS
ncbi:MAG: nitroreductase [Saprospiraceae bacterium]|nr:nitroreductase [Saprospiraceae bacterium]HMW38223.1 nitroreductase [Saprospiraceae bacterium]HMX87418.1 nitroreductase [Saprospiraceae bacterium]HMZ39245.1 nitroreductase [Saprospiraceae bacterium]HNA65166.1 nitroreductase [Saprospiraceae bacterium]